MLVCIIRVYSDWINVTNILEYSKTIASDILTVLNYREK